MPTFYYLKDDEIVQREVPTPEETSPPESRLGSS